MKSLLFPFLSTLCFAQNGFLTLLHKRLSRRSVASRNRSNPRETPWNRPRAARPAAEIAAEAERWGQEDDITVVKVAYE